MSATEFDEVWRWDGWTTANDISSGGAVDEDGNVVLVGSQGTITMSSNPDDDTFTDATTGNFAAVKLDGTSGKALWIWTDSSLGDEADHFFGADTDSNNDVFLGGRTEGYWADYNPYYWTHIAAVKLDGSTGNEIWRYQEAPPDSTTISNIWPGLAAAISVAVDNDDNVIFAGQTYGSLVDGEGSYEDSDYFVMKLDGADGEEIWTIQGGASGSTTSFDSLVGVKADSTGDIVGVGIGRDQDAVDFVVVKFSGVAGTLLWEYSPVTASTHDTSSSVDIDAQGDVYVSGSYDADNLQGGLVESPVILKLDGATGDVIWTYEGVATSRAAFFSVAVDPATGWVLGAGMTEGTWLTGAAQGNEDFAAVVLDGDTGDELARYQSGTTGDDYLSFAGFDSVGGLFLGGGWTNDDDQEFVALKFDMTSAMASKASTAGLAEWEIGTIASGMAALLALLGLCFFCFRRKRSRGRRGPPKASSRSAPVQAFNYPTAQAEVPQAQPQPPVEASTLPAFSTPHRQQREAAAVEEAPLPAYKTPHRPEQKAAAVEGGSLPAYKTPHRPEPEAAAVEEAPLPAYQTPLRPQQEAVVIEKVPPPAYLTPHRPPRQAAAVEFKWLELISRDPTKPPAG